MTTSAEELYQAWRQEHERLLLYGAQAETHTDPAPVPEISAASILAIMDRFPRMPKIIESEWLPETDSKGNPIFAVMISPPANPVTGVKPQQMLIIRAPKRERE